MGCLGCLEKPLIGLFCGIVGFAAFIAMFQSDSWEMLVYCISLVLGCLGFILMTWSDGKAGDWGGGFFTASIALGGGLGSIEAIRQGEWFLGGIVGLVAIGAAIIVLFLLKERSKRKPAHNQRM
ncbi:hypothetical protein J9317_17930 [Metabacillus sp. KIGAM252]|uniref:Uncharacterized protein n=1 Tax=Metabacillus flavus TaxID=2823519 RepID=A0ABS5LIT4_9BACI|nr:hypothetical protein [Metabacillus flavus]MBS2970627.1 hypothetical protein [Metabacillus flavus]